MKLTIKDIARMSGVSISSVSRVLNDSKPVSDEIREKVNGVIKKTNFHPNALARGLINRSTNLIGVIIPQVNSISAELINGIEDVAYQNGYNIILSNSQLNKELELEALDIFNEKQVDGIILSSVVITEQHARLIHENDIPVVVVGQKASEYNIPWVDVNNYTPITKIVRYLVECGHEKIAMIHGPLKDKSAGYTRYKAFLDETSRLNLPMSQNSLVESNFSTKDGYKAMEILLRNSTMPTAVVCASDTIAIGAKNCLEDRGLVIPDNVSIVGFDDSELASIVRPKLTTVRVSSFEVGSKAMEILIGLIKDGKIKQLENYVDYRIVIRDSVGVIKGRGKSLQP